jgi:hypothetical protein
MRQSTDDNGNIIHSNALSSPLNRAQIGSYTASMENSDFAVQRQTLNGGMLVELSIDPLTEDKTSILSYNGTIKPPFTIDIPFSISQRTRQQFFELDAIAMLPNPVDMVTTYPSSAIASISQSATNITIVLSTATNIKVGEWFDVTGIDDSRLNICNANVASVSADRKTITCAYTGDAANSSLTITAITGMGTFYPQSIPSNIVNGIAMKFTQVNSTACFAQKSANSNVRVSGNITNSQSATNSSTQPAINNLGNGQFEIKPTTSFEMSLDKTEVRFDDYGIDSFASQSIPRYLQNTTIPEYSASYTPQLRAVTPKSVSRPIAGIVSAVKTGTTTATITTDLPHGLIAGKSVVDIYGCRDQTNFVATNGLTVASVINSTSFTVVFGTAVTATTYGGMISINNNSLYIIGRSTQAIQSISIDSDGVLSVVGNTTWTVVTVGEYVNLYGVHADLTGADMGLDGAYVLIDLWGSTIKLKAVTNIDGTRTKNGLGVDVTPALPVTASTNCGGAVMMRTTGRIHDLRMEERKYDAVKLWGQGEARTDLAIPVTVQNSIPAGSNLIGITTSRFENPNSTLMGAIPTSYILTASTNVNLIGTLRLFYGATVSNVTATGFWLKLYNKATAPTVGTDVPIYRVFCPANITTTFEVPMYFGASFNTGLGFATTGLVADADTTAVVAGSVVSIMSR